MIYLGLDPGASGAIAALNADGSILLVGPTPPTDAEVLAVLEGLSSARSAAPSRIFAVIEYVQAFPKMGTSSAFNFGKGYGALLMALHAAEIPFDVVVPRKWQGALSCLSGGDKNITKRRAQQLWPSHPRITHAIADALLIAEYCRRLRIGSNGQEESSSKEISRLEEIWAPGEGCETCDTIGARPRKRPAAGPPVPTAPGHGAGPKRTPR